MAPGIIDFLRNDINSLKSDMDNLRKEFEHHKNVDFGDLKKHTENEFADIKALLDQFVKKPDFEHHKNETEAKLKSHQDSIDELFKLLEELKKNLSDKLGCDAFDEHMIDYNNLKALVLAL